MGREFDPGSPDSLSSASLIGSGRKNLKRDWFACGLVNHFNCLALGLHHLRGSTLKEVSVLRNSPEFKTNSQIGLHILQGIGGSAVQHQEAPCKANSSLRPAVQVSWLPRGPVPTIVQPASLQVEHHFIHKGLFHTPSVLFCFDFVVVWSVLYQWFCNGQPWVSLLNPKDSIFSKV